MISRRIFPPPVAAKVPQVTARFWAAKVFAVASGVATSHVLAHGSHAAGAAAEIALLAAGLAWQFRVRRYTAGAYWLLSYAMAVFVTGLSAGLHEVIGVPHNETMLLWAGALVVLAVAWERRKLRVRAVATRPGEAHYWALGFAALAFCLTLSDDLVGSLQLWYLSPLLALAGAAILVPAVDCCLRLARARAPRLRPPLPAPVTRAPAGAGRSTGRPARAGWRPGRGCPPGRRRRLAGHRPAGRPASSAAAG